MAGIFAVETRGVGKPDYSREISLGRERPGIYLKYGQSLKIFGAVFSDIPSEVIYIRPKLAKGATAHAVDWETGLDLPYTLAQGYLLASFQGSYSYSQDMIIRVFIDLQLVTSVGVPIGGASLYAAEILGWATSFIDPLAASAHLYDVQLTNLGGAALEGAGSIYTILEAVGTGPLPTTKEVKCKFCGHQWTVPRATSLVKCPNCGERNIYADLSKFRRAP